MQALIWLLGVLFYVFMSCLVRASYLCAHERKGHPSWKYEDEASLSGVIWPLFFLYLLILLILRGPAWLSNKMFLMCLNHKSK